MKRTITGSKAKEPIREKEEEEGGMVTRRVRHTRKCQKRSGNVYRQAGAVNVIIMPEGAVCCLHVEGVSL